MKTLLIITVSIVMSHSLFSQSELMLEKLEEIDKQYTKNYLMIGIEGASSKLESSKGTYSIGYGFGLNEIKFEHSNYAGEYDEIDTYRKSSITLILFFPVYDVLEREYENAFEYKTYSLQYVRHFYLFDWLNFGVQIGLGYGEGFKKYATNEHSEVIDTENALLAYKQVKIYTCDTYSKTLDSFFVPFGLELDILFFDWWHMNLGWSQSTGTEMQDTHIHIGTSLHIEL